MFVGRPPGNYDRLLDVSQAVTGSLFFVPSRPLLESLADDPADSGAAEAGPGTTGSAAEDSGGDDQAAGPAASTEPPDRSGSAAYEE